MKFILFDIDGTLIDSGGAGTRSLDLAFEEMFSIRDAFKSVSIAGKTDIRIIKEGLELHNLDCSDNLITEFCMNYIKHLGIQIKNGKGHVKNGVKDALDAIKEDEDFILGLLTGNIEKGARIKLDFYGLNTYFDIGVFGDNDEDRNNLLPIAVNKLFSQSSVRISFRDCVVIGDTPNDVACSKPYGALSIAVATGPYSFKTLLDAGPDEVLEDLSETEKFISILKKDA